MLHVIFSTLGGVFMGYRILRNFVKPMESGDPKVLDIRVFDSPKKSVAGL